MPDGLELQERLDLGRALLVGGRANDPLDVLGGQPLELRGVSRDTRHIDRVDVHVPCEPGSELVSESREDVHGAARKVGRRERLRQFDRGRGMLLGGDRDHGVSPDERRRETRNETAEGRLGGRENCNDPRWLGNGEVEVGTGDRIRASEHLRDLVRPARVPDYAIDRGFNLLPA